MSKVSEYFSNSARELKSLRTYLEVFAEFFGTFLFMIVGIGSAQMWVTVKPDRMQIGLCFGISFGAAVAITQPISGGLLNPAATLTHILFGRIYLLKALLFIIFQCIGAILGAQTVLASIPESAFSLGATQLSGVNELQGLVIEIVVAFLLMLVVETCNDPGRQELYNGGPMLIGFTMAACIISIMPWTGGSLNPAKTLGAAVMINDFESFWVYCFGPTIGSILGCLIYQSLYRKQPEEEENVFSKE